MAIELCIKGVGAGEGRQNTHTHRAQLSCAVVEVLGENYQDLEAASKMANARRALVVAQVCMMMVVLVLELLQVEAAHDGGSSIGNRISSRISSRSSSIDDEDDEASSCDASVEELMNNCKAYVVPGLLMGSLPIPSNPSPCCSSVQSARFPCICSRATGPVLSFIDKQAVKNVLQACDVIVPSGTTCGGITWN